MTITDLKNLKKKEYFLNYYNILYTHSKFHNKIYFFLRKFDNDVKYVSFNFLKKKYYKYHTHKDLNLFYKSLGSIKKKENFKKRFIKNNNLNFINYFEENNNYVLRCYSNIKLNFQIVRELNNLNSYTFLNKIFHNSLVKNRILDKNYLNNFFFFFNNSLFNFFKKYFKILNDSDNKFNILQNILNKFYLLIKLNKRKNSISKNFKLFLNILKFYKNNELFKSVNLKEYLMKIFIKFIYNLDIKLPISIMNIEKNKKKGIKSNIFTIFKSNKNKNLKFEFFIFSYIKKFFYTFIFFKKHEEIKENYYIYLDFYFLLFLNSKFFLFDCLNKEIDLQNFFS
jgi:hypothetical protein